jgi:hypothetical protein
MIGSHISLYSDRQAQAAKVMSLAPLSSEQGSAHPQHRHLPFACRSCELGVAFAWIVMVLLFVPCSTASAAPREQLTLDNFGERFATPALTPVLLPPFECKPDARDPSAVICMNNPRYGGVGANIVLRGKATTRELMYVAVAVANPQLHQEPHSTALAGFYVLLTSQVMRMLTPEIGPDRAMKILAALQENAERNQNQIRVNGWSYGAGTGLVLIFAAERK